MTTQEIQHALQAIQRESREWSAALRTARQREPHSDEDVLAVFAAFESWELKYCNPAPGRTTLTFASFTFEEQEQLEGYAEQFINEAHALCLRLQERCPTFREGEAGRGEMYELERFYRAQYQAMERLERRCDDREWIHGHIKRARKFLEWAQSESVN